MFERYFVATLFALHMHVLRWWREYAALVLGLLFLYSVGYFLFLAPPRDFPTGALVRIAQGSALGSIATQLATQKVVRSSGAFVLLTRIMGGSRSINAGAYRFTESLSAFGVSQRLIQGESGIPPVRLTFPEGLTLGEMAALIRGAYSKEFANDFVKDAQLYEGYLFPDTYIFSSGDTPESIVERLRSTFTIRTMPLIEEVRASGHTLAEVVTMASLLEGEAKTPEDMRIIAGILWKRLAINMALQVDVAPSTYASRGLPQTPINNPGLVALRAALLPTKTKYLYYLTGSDGKMHYAKTFEEHQANQGKYLK